MANCSETDIAEAWGTCYATLSEAITAWWDIEIVKAGEYTLPVALTNVTSIKKANDVKWVVTLKVNAWSIEKGGEIISLTNDITFEWITLKIEGVHDWTHIGDKTNKIIMKDCTIDGVMHIRWDIDFNGCTFTTTVSRFVNIAWGWDAEYEINFKDSTLLEI